MGRVWPGVLLELIRGSCWTPAWVNNNGGPNPKENIYLLLSLCALCESVTVHQLAKGIFTGSSTSVTEQDQEPVSHENIDLEQRGMSHTNSQVSFQEGWENNAWHFQASRFMRW